jgi:hypothetical protein
MKQGSRIILTAIAAAALGATATAFAHGGDRAGGGMHGAQGCPMHADAGQAKRQGEHGMGHDRVAHRMNHGMAHDAAKSESKPETDETHKH